MKLSELAALIDGTVIGDRDVEITGARGIRDAGQGEITFLSDKKTLSDVPGTKASAVITDKKSAEFLKDSNDRINIVVAGNPQYAFARVLETLYANPRPPSGISERAEIGYNVNFGNDISVYPLAYIGDNVRLGDRVTIFPGAYIAKGVSINNDSVIHANVSILEQVFIGRNVIIHSGTVIGSDGFGYILEKGEHYKIPQIGGVIIEDNVEIGSNVSIDRGATGNTVIGRGTKIDNQVQIAHNVSIGKNCIIVSQVGISGSVEVGDRVILAGKVGVKDHVTIGSGAVIAAGSGIAGDIPEGRVYAGRPAIPHTAWLRSQSIVKRLPEYIKRLQEIENKIQSIIVPKSEVSSKEVPSDDE
ncbi:MAG: UDP-3-O-(3-hydroxymyristoyl)glucosamine N-acyltransferase [Nitrospiraceae bacterium]|nr:MAG: UDP-3-O-(3-hydroxymyristoyl)glucosamine N-acyltransferase [Nitrospiraceae bacterium]